jgi:hypothetical protein
MMRNISSVDIGYVEVEAEDINSAVSKARFFAKQKGFSGAEILQIQLLKGGINDAD